MLTFLLFFGSGVLIGITAFVINYQDRDISSNSIGDWMYEDFYEIDFGDVIFFEPIIDEVSGVSTEVHKLIYWK